MRKGPSGMPHFLRDRNGGPGGRPFCPHLFIALGPMWVERARELLAVLLLGLHFLCTACWPTEQRGIRSLQRDKGGSIGVFLSFHTICRLAVPGLEHGPWRVFSDPSHQARALHSAAVPHFFGDFLVLRIPHLMPAIPSFPSYYLVVFY